MYVFEIVTPGTFLVAEDQDWTSRISRLLSSLENHFFQANTALNLFASDPEYPRPDWNMDDYDRDQKRRSEIRHSVESEFELGNTVYDAEDISFETDVRFKREKWANGAPPYALEFKKQFIYAQAFIYALDGFDKFLGVLAKEDNVPEEIGEKHLQFIEKFPNLRGVRNTAQHLEDRSRGLDFKKNPLVLPPDGANNLRLNCLAGSRIGSTMSDGHYGEVDVSAESMQHLQEILEGVLQAFEWSGSKKHSPSA